VCFTGVDGSGKTTHARLAKKHLEENGFSVKYTWGAFRPFLSCYFFGLTRLLGYWERTKKDAYTDPLESAPGPLIRKLGKIWRLSVFVDYQLKVLVQIRLPLLLGKDVVCDRYFYDILMELKLSNVLSERFALWLPKSLPQPMVTFLLDVPEVSASIRRNFPKEFFSGRRKAFQELADSFKFVVIDSSMDLSENQQVIRQEILKRLQNR